MDQSKFISSRKKFLLIGDSSDSNWASILREALNPLGQLESILENEIPLNFQPRHYDLIIIDAAMVDSSEKILATLSQKQSNIPIVVVTNSPTWQRARRAFLSGATDYIRKSLDAKTLLAVFQRILTKSESIK